MSTATVTALSPLLAAAAEGERSAAVVSLHDVAPTTQSACARILDEVARLGISRCSLLVVPNFHQSGSSFADRNFVSWLRQMEAAGHEIVIHGYYHQRPRRGGESAIDKLVTRLYTNEEGEFYDLPYEEARRRISIAREEFSTAGLKPHGFIAPAWLLSADGERAAADCGLEYTTRLASVRDLRFGNTYSARSLVYSVRSGWRRSVSLLWNAGLFRRAMYSPLLRLSLHPPDIEHPEIWRQISRFLAAIAVQRNAATYGEWVAQMRVNSSN